MTICNVSTVYEKVTGDLFSYEPSDVIVHFVSECLTMNSGITLQFRDKFNKIDNLILQKKRKRNCSSKKGKQ